MEKAFDKLPYKVAHKTSLDMLMFMVPPALQGQIKDSTEDDLVSTGSAMLAFLRRLPEFKHVNTHTIRSVYGTEVYVLVF